MFNTPIARLAGVLIIAELALAGVFMVVFNHVDGPVHFPVLFWWQISVGLGAFLISGWVWSLRPGDIATRLFLLSGLATLTFTFAPAPFNVEGLAPTDTLISILVLLNSGGATAFGISMIALFLVYPNRLPGWKWLGGLALLIFGVWSTIVIIGTVPRINNLHQVTLIEMVAIFAALLAQYFAARQDPRSRAILIWLGGAVLLGAGAFITTIALPRSFDLPSLINPRWAFGFFLIIYIGCAAGLVRYRLFELGDWAYRALFYASAAALLIALDAMLIVFLPLDQGPALGMSLIAVTFLYLPFRDSIARLVLKRANLSDQDLLREVIDSAFSPAGERAQLWRASLQKLFEPLELRVGETPNSDVRIADEGLLLCVPALADSPALELRYPWRGQGLFGPRHAQTAQQLVDLMRQAEESRAAHERGANEERGRIARDMHDNIGAQLLGALHSRESDRKDSLIRETLTDLRNIINDAPDTGLGLSNMLADLRAETAERLSSAGIRLDWHDTLEADISIQPQSVHALRSVIREGVSNVIKHSGAKTTGIDLASDHASLSVTIRDDGHGFDDQQTTHGNGLDNMRSRVTSQKGRIEFQSNESGTQIIAFLPADHARGTP